MPETKFKRSKRPAHSASRVVRKLLMQRAVAIVGAFALVVAGIGAFAMSAQAAPHPVQKDTVADDSTLANWSGEVGIENTTENVGRIWTDKTVQDGDITLSGGDAGSVTINKGSSDFLVGLSALSSMSNTMTTSTTPLDIVLVLDMSGSMSNELSSEQQFVYNEVYEQNVQESDAVEEWWGWYQQRGDTYYVLIGDEYVQLVEKTHTEEHGGGWNNEYDVHDSWNLPDEYGGTEVFPKTNDGDNADGHYQFYTRRTETVTTTKIDALKEAVNEFIETTNQANASLPADGKHEISIVKFAGDSTNEIGNDNYYLNHMYPDVNYSQVVTDFISDETALENYVSSLEPAGATRADLGMEQAQRVIDGDRRYNLEGARENSKKVVIFFTDGQPTSSDTWDEGVANNAIKTAREMKNDQNDSVTIYSIGVFEDANPEDTTDNRFNRYMHAVSSNYPDATGYQSGRWGNMGDRAPDSDYYKAATSSDELSQIFQGISEDIGSGTGAPTQTKGENTETTSGYITITDQLGDYMQFDGMNSVVFAGQQFTQVSGPTQDTAEGYEDWERYTYQGEANNEIYPNGNLDQLIIRVKKGTDLQTGDTVQVQIPASLIPTRYFDVDATAGTMSVTDAYPIRIFYGVSLKGGVADSIAAGAPMSGLSQADYDELATYVRSNQYTKDDGTAYASFLSNAWSGGSNGNTTSSFEPSSGNEFYYFTKPTTLYSDAACEHPVASVQDIRDGQTYYYKNTFWQFTDENADTDGTPYKAKETFTPFALTAAQARQLATGRDGDGNVCIPAGTRHMAMISELVENKAEGANKTSTATSVINPNWAGTGENETIDAALGNNGRLGIELPGTLSVTKKITVPTGVDAAQFANTDFPFQITMADAANYTFKAQVKNADRTIANPASGEGYFDLAFNNQGVSTTVSLKPNQTLTIYGLGDGWTYSVAEVGEMPDGFKQTTPAGGAAVTGAIDQATPAVAEFTNTYSFNDDVTINGETDLSGTKTLVGRPWQDGDRFDFEIRVATGSKYANGTSVPRDAQPMPKTGTVQANGNVRISLTNDEAQGAASSKPVDFNFGDIEYGAPGTYNYIIREVSYNAGADGYVAGITYAQNRYFVQVVVTDNGQGELSAEATMRTLDAQDQVGQTVDLAAFTNTWSASDVSVMIEGDKNFSDSTRPGVTTAAQDQFFFRITAEDGGPLPVPDASNDVVRDEGANYIVVTTLPAGMVQFGNAAFNDEMVGDTYTYTIEEVVKQDDQYVSVKEAIEPVDGAYVLNGMTYDATEWTLAVTVTADGSQLKATPSYTGGTPQDGSFVFTNSYDPADATLTGDAAIHGTKTLTGRDMTGDEHFTFTLKGEDPATTTAMTDGTITFGGQSQAEYTKSVSGADKGTPEGFNFGDMVINKDGTYTFNLSETGYMDGGTTYAGAQLDSPINGIAFDRHVCTVTVTVTDEGGQLTGKVEYNTENGGSAFTNTYTANKTYGTDVYLTVGKTLTGRDMKAREFTFEISATGENADAARAKLDEANIASTFRNPQAAYDGTESTWTIFENLAFNQDDAGKTFTYQVKEQIPAEEDRAGVTYDGSVYEVAIQVVDDADGTMHTVTTVKKGGEQVGDPFDSSTGTVAPKLSFENSYHGAPVTVDPEIDTRLQFNKVVTGRDWLERDSFEFSIKKVSFNGATDGDTLAAMPDPEQATVTLGGAAQAGAKADERVPFDFGQMTFTEAGTYVYRVDETNTGDDGQGLTYDGHTVDIVIEVRDNDAGNLVVDGIYPLQGASTTFTNTYASKVNYPEDAASLSVQKTLTGHAMADGQFEFTVTPADEASAKKVDLWQNEAIQSATGSWGAAADGEAAVTPINWNLTFTQADSGKTYTYKFVEVVPEDVPAGYSYDGTTYTVAITPTDNQDGTMSVTTVVTKKTAEGESTETYTYSTDDPMDNIVLPFVNTYGTDGTSVDTQTTANFTKVIDGRDWIDADSFQFTITPEGDAPAFEGADPDTKVKTVNVTASNPEVNKITGADGTVIEVNGRSFNFGTVKFTDEDMTGATMVNGKLTKIFTYTVNEVEPADGYKIPGMNYDTDHEATLTITVVDNGDGTMTATPRITDDVFWNLYSASVDGAAFGGFQITKTLTGHAMTAGQFEFTVTPVDGTGTTAADAAAKLGITDDNKKVPSIAADDGETVTVGTFDLADDMKFTQDDAGKTFVYEVTETKKGGDGYTNDDATYRVEIAVKHDAATATLTVTTTVTKDGAPVGEPVVVTNTTAERATATVPFENSYSASTQTEGGTSATVSTTKTLEGRPLEAGEFTFQVAYADGDKAVVKSDVTNAADGTVDFGSFNYTTESLAQMVNDGRAQKTADGWTIQYTASEVTDGLADVGVTATDQTFSFTITVVDNGDGTLTATADLPEGHGFKNTYTSTGEGGLPVTVTPAGTKVIEAEDGLTPDRDALAGKFTFTLSSNDPNAPMPAAGGEVATNDAQGNVTFGTIEFSLDNLNKALDAQAGTDEGIDTQEVGGTPREYTFTYQVTESGGVDYVQNDETTVREFSYTVHDDGEGNLTVTREPEAGALFTFTNTYTVEPELSSPTGAGQLTITKTLIGRDMNQGEFSFKLSAVSSGWWTAATNPAAGDGEAANITFGEILFTEPGTYQYTLQEENTNKGGVEYDTSVYTVTAEVKDTGTGELEVTWSINGTQDKTVAFENTYEAKPASMSFGASKVLTGRDLEDGEFSFQVTDETGEALYANGTNDAAGTVNFDPITFNQAGTYHLWISEVLPEDDDAETEGIQSENVTYDETRYELVVTVEDNGTGNLEVTNVEEVDGTPVFENVYTEPVEPVLPGGDSLEQTGDTMPLMMGTVAVAGAALVAGGLVVRRKHGE